MTVASTTARNDYTGNGVLTVYAYTFRILDASHIAVRLNGVLQTLTTHYTVSQVNNPAGGNVTFLVAPPNAQAIIFSRVVPITQLVDLLEQGNFPAETVELELDKLTMIAQMLKEIQSDPGLTPLPGNLLSTTIIDAKGDLIVGSAADTAVRLAAGGLGTWLHAAPGLNLAWHTKESTYDIATDGGCVGDGTTDNTSALQTLINAVPEGSTLFVPPGTFQVNGTVTIAKRLRILGCHRTQAFIRSTSSTNVTISIATNEQVIIERIQLLRNGSTPTDGAGIRILDGGGGLFNQFSIIEDCVFNGQWIGLDIVAASSIRVTGCYFVGSRLRGAQSQNTVQPDAGVGYFIANTFDSTVSGSTGYLLLNGGCYFIGNTILRHSFGFTLSPGNGVNTSILIMVGNSLENQFTTGITLGTVGTGTFLRVVISGNQITANGTTGAGITCNAQSASALSDVAITGNKITVTAGMTAILVDRVTRASVIGNNIEGSGAASVGISITVNAVTCYAADNGIVGVTSLFANLSTTTIIHHFLGIAAANLPVALNGSMVYCTDCLQPGDGGFAAGNCAGGGTGNMAKRQNTLWKCS